MALLLAALAVAAAQTSPGAILLDRQRVDRAQPTPPPRRTAAAPALPAIHDAPDTPIRGIRFVGAKAPAAVAAAARPFVRRKATRQTLVELTAALSAAYAKAPVALYSVAIPQQDFAGGVVIVSLTEGRIATAQLKGAKPGAQPLLRRRLTRLTSEAPLSRATWERQMTLAQAIPGLTVATDVADPQATGALVLTATPKQKRTRFTAGFSNRGVDLLGDGEWDASAAFYGAAIDGDQLSVSASAAADLTRYRYVSAGYSAPIGADGLSAGANVAYLETRPKGYAVTGHARQAGLSLSYPLIRSFHRSADLSLGVDALNSDNAAFGSIVADERTRAVRLAGSVADTQTRRELSASAAISRGLDGLGARVATPGVRTDFTKATASAAASHAIGKRLVARLTASGQWSRDALPAAERFAIGGAAIGRAFDTGLLTGDRGGGGSGELAYRPLGEGRFATSELYLFGDGGAVTVLPRAGSGAQTYDLASAGVGARARYKEKAELGLEAARVVDAPYPGYGEDWRLTVGWRLSL